MWSFSRTWEAVKLTVLCWRCRHRHPDRSDAGSDISEEKNPVSCEAMNPLAQLGITFFLIWLYILSGPWPLFQFPKLYVDGRAPWMSDQPVARPLPTHRTTQTQNKRTQTSMPWVGFEHTIPAFERAKTVHALDRAAIRNNCFSKFVRFEDYISPRNLYQEHTLSGFV
jgi:hypothetical protein